MPDLPVRIVVDHQDTGGYHEWITLGERVRANRLGIPNRRMWDARWTKWTCNGRCGAWALVSDDGIRSMLTPSPLPRRTS